MESSGQKDAPTENAQRPKYLDEYELQDFLNFSYPMIDVNASLCLSKLLRFRVAIKSVVSALSTAITFWLSILFSAFRKPG